MVWSGFSGGLLGKGEVHLRRFFLANGFSEAESGCLKGVFLKDAVRCVWFWKNRKCFSAFVLPS